MPIMYMDFNIKTQLADLPVHTDENGLQYVNIPRGSQIYRGGERALFGVTRNFAAFYSSRDVADEYTKVHPGTRTNIYHIKNDLKILVTTAATAESVLGYFASRGEALVHALFIVTFPPRPVTLQQFRAAASYLRDNAERLSHISRSANAPADLRDYFDLMDYYAEMTGQPSRISVRDLDKTLMYLLRPIIEALGYGGIIHTRDQYFDDSICRLINSEIFQGRAETCVPTELVVFNGKHNLKPLHEKSWR